MEDKCATRPSGWCLFLVGQTRRGGGPTRDEAGGENFHLDCAMRATRKLAEHAKPDLSCAEIHPLLGKTHREREEAKLAVSPYKPLHFVLQAVACVGHVVRHD